MNLKTGQESVSRTEQMTAATTVVHVQQLLEQYPNVPILLLWDRAPWHRGPAIRAVVEANPRLTIMQFPTAAPDLNPQEHVWRATRRSVSHNHTERRLPELALQFEQHLTDTTFSSSFLDQYGWNLVCPAFS